MTTASGRESGYSFHETYQLYNEQLHYARANYTREQLDRWQADWNHYFVQFGMELPSYAHKVTEQRKPETTPPDKLAA